jgi:hypothetical protein
MAITSYAALKARQGGDEEKVMVMKTAPTSVLGRTFSSWTTAGIPTTGAAPTTAAVPTRATTGALGQINPTGTRRIIDFVVAWSRATGGMVTICDRLSHQGGLSGTTAGAQTTNLPTAALTRYTSGVGVMAGLDIYTVVGTTQTTVTASYTNQAGTAGQVAPLQLFGNTGFREASLRLLLPLVAGDTGVRAVASVSLTASTLTAGNFGVTLFYPLISIPIDYMGRPASFCVPQHEHDDSPFMKYTWLPQIQTDACLEFLAWTAGTSYSLMAGLIRFAED